MLSKLRVDTFKLQLKLWCQEPEPMKAHIIDQSLNGYIVMSYYLLPPVNHNQQAYLFFFHNFNDRLWLANQKPNTNSITNPWSVYNVEIANFGCNYLGFHTVYRLENFWNFFVLSFSTCMQSFGQIWNMAKNLVRMLSKYV